jgi:large subunit ribosomal protein L4e
MIDMPSVFRTPIRPDLIKMAHTNMNKNHRQPYAVSDKAGHQTAASSWGTGRAVSRVARVPGSGTNRSGQAAFGNMCRGGHMFAPTKIWRRWHRRLNNNVKRYGVASAIAASAVPSLVQSRGHLISYLREVPLVIDDSVKSISKTSKALAIIKAIGAHPDLKRAIKSHHLRKGRGKFRNRRYTTRKGPMIVFASNHSITGAFRNLPGIDTTKVDRINLLDLAPGGQLGRFLIWTKSAFKEAEEFNSKQNKRLKQMNNDFYFTEAYMSNPDLTRIINSDEIQSVLKAPKEHNKDKHYKSRNKKKNGNELNIIPKKIGSVQSIESTRRYNRKVIMYDNKTAKTFYKQLLVDSEYLDPGCKGFRSWLGLHAR